jgi:hypothetical protein
MDVIVAEGLAQRHPQRRGQVSASHNKFRQRLANATARACVPADSGSGSHSGPTIRSLQVDATTLANASSSLDRVAISDLQPAAPVADAHDACHGYQLHSLQITDDDPADFEQCCRPRIGLGFQVSALMLVCVCTFTCLESFGICTLCSRERQRRMDFVVRGLPLKANALVIVTDTDVISSTWARCRNKQGAVTTERDIDKNMMCCHQHGITGERWRSQYQSENL